MENEQRATIKDHYLHYKTFLENYKQKRHKLTNEQIIAHESYITALEEFLKAIKKYKGKQNSLINYMNTRKLYYLQALRRCSDSYLKTYYQRVIYYLERLNNTYFKRGV